MRKFCTFMVVGSLFISCFSEKTDSRSTVYEQEFYSVLNDLIASRFSNTSVVQRETKPVLKMYAVDDGPFDSLYIPPPSFDVYYDSFTFDFLVMQEILDSAEAKYMYASIDTTRIITIEPSKISLPLISASRIQELFSGRNRDMGYETIKRTYGTRCFIKASTPVFNSDFTIVVISIDYQCGFLYGEGYQFIMKKKDGKWVISKEKGTWVS